MTKRFVALARVSSREQEREGFSLDVQEEALNRYAERAGGEIVQFYRVAETASKALRKTFKELLAYAKANATRLDGVLFYKIDRAARNIYDYVELERLEKDYAVPLICVSQPTENTPAGRMQRRIMANMASFYTEQQALDVKEGLARRVQAGLFVGRARYGYRNVRVDGRGLIHLDGAAAGNVKRIFELYAYHNHTLDSLAAALAAEGRTYRDDQRYFVRSQLHAILRDRSYIGDVPYLGRWLAGTHEPLIDRPTFDRVQVLLGDKVYGSHESVYGAGMVTCGHCGKLVVVEVVTKKAKKGPREYRYYRCARYKAEGHPPVRVTEADLDAQVLALLDRMKVGSPEIHDWVVEVLRAIARDSQKASGEKRAELQRQVALVTGQKDRLLNLRLLDEINADTFADKQAELRDREAELNLHLEALGRQGDEQAELAVKAFELSQSLRAKWDTADIAEKRQILEIVCLNFRLDGVTLVPTIRKPFDVLVEGPLVLQSRGDWI